MRKKISVPESQPKKYVYYEPREIEIKFQPEIGEIIESTDDAIGYFRAIWDKDMMNLQEQCYVLFLNTANRILGCKLISTGTISSATVDIKLIIGIALKCRATAIILAHNHPSKSLKPSGEDIKVTYELKKTCELFNIKLLDHLILSENDYYWM